MLGAATVPINRCIGVTATLTSQTFAGLRCKECGHAYAPEAATIDLSDLSSERLDPESLRVAEDGVLRCTVKGRFPARFSQAAQAHLLLAVDAAWHPPRLRMGAREIPVPGLDTG